MWLHEQILTGADTFHTLSAERPLIPRLEILVVRRDATVMLPVGWQALVINLAGRARISSELGVLNVPGRHWLISDPDLPASVQSARRGLAIVVASNVAARRQLRIEHRLLPGFGKLTPEFLQSALRMIRQTQAPASAYWQRDVQVHSLIEHLADAQAGISARLARVPGKSRAARLRTLARLQRACLYAACNTDRPVRVADMARLARFSIWHFSRTFARVFDATALEYVQALRLDHARELLAHGEHSASEIANACGFENASAFARAYRRRFGHAPSQTRALALAAQIAHRRAREIANPVAQRTGVLPIFDRCDNAHLTTGVHS